MTTETVAIVGMSCRFAGEATGLHEFWQLLVGGRNVISPPPAYRWRKDDPYAHALKPAGYLQDVSGFDPVPFGIAEGEAARFDPQQRLLLDLCWLALEDARLDPKSLRGQAVGVFVGAGPVEYEQLELAHDEAFAGIATARGALSGQLAECLGLDGPALTVDASCASSLVALHQAVMSIQQGECSIALVGGVNLLLSSKRFATLDAAGLLAKDGRCKAFAANADGFGRGEGAGVLVLKAQAAARADSDRVYANILGSALGSGSGGASPGTPSPPLQSTLLRRALRRADLSPSDISYVETHASGLPVADSEELLSLAEVFSERKRQLLLGSLKPNLGHLEAASGIASVIKAALCIHHGFLVPSLLSSELSAEGMALSSRVKLQQEALAWPEAERRIAGVSSFGTTGTHAHCILGSSDLGPDLQKAPPATSAGLRPIVLSGHSPSMLRANARLLACHLESAAMPPSLSQLAFSLGMTRHPFAVRFALPVTQADADGGYPELRRELEALANDRATTPRAHSAVATAGGAMKLAAMFSGEGSQRVGMGRALYGSAGFEAFTISFDATAMACAAHLPRPLAETLWTSDASWLRDPIYSEPALFALHAALFSQWRAFGIDPDVLLGHCVGEVSAAYAGGVLSLEDAATLVCARGRCIAQQAQRGGAMVELRAREALVQAALRDLPPALRSKVGIAATNSRDHTVVAGDRRVVNELVSRLQPDGAIPMAANFAFHSPHIEPALDAFERVATHLTYHPPRRPIVSTLTGKLADPSLGELVTPQYWTKQLSQPVRFGDALVSAAQARVQTFLEIGPGATLHQLAIRYHEHRGPTASVPSLSGQVPEPVALTSALCCLHVRGHTLNWPAILGRDRSQAVDLPLSALQRRPYWLSDRVKPNPSPLVFRPEPAAWALSGRRTELPAGGYLHVLDIGPGVQAYLADHVVHGAIVVPEAFHLALLLSLATEYFPQQQVSVSDVHFYRTIAFQAATDRAELCIQLTPELDGRYQAVVASQLLGTWVTHAVGTLSRSFDAPLAESVVELDQLQLSSATPVLDELSDSQVRLSERWRWLKKMVTVCEVTYGALARPAGVPSDEAPLASGLIDNTLLLGGRSPVAVSDPYLPRRVKRLIYQPGGSQPAWARATNVDESGKTLLANYTWFDSNGQALAQIEGVSSQRTPKGHLFGVERSQTRDVYDTKWLPVMPQKSTPTGTWLLGGTEALARALAPELRLTGLRDVVGRLRSAAAQPQRLIVDLGSRDDTPDTMLQLATDTLDALQLILAEPRLASTTLVWITRDGVSTGGEATCRHLAEAPVWGLVRSARAKYPSRQLRLVDLDSAPSDKQLRSLVFSDLEPELALRRGVAHAPRLARSVAPGGNQEVTGSISGTGTVLITGALNGLAPTLARHLVRRHGVKHLLLLSSLPVDDSTATSLTQSLRAHGARSVTILGYDVKHRSSLARALAHVAPQHPLTGVFHLEQLGACVPFSELESEHLTSALEHRALSAFYLHELTAHENLDVFVMFSSLCGLLGADSMAHHASAACYLDLLAEERQRQGRVATSLAWGDVAAISALSNEESMAMLDAVLTRPEATCVPVQFDLSQLRDDFSGSTQTPAVLRSLLQPPAPPGPALELPHDSSRALWVPRHQGARQELPRISASASGAAS